LPDTHHTANGAEPQIKEDASSLCDWGELHSKDELPDYNENIFWEPKSDSEDGDTRALSSTTAKIVKDAFSCSLKSEKHKSIKRKQPIHDTPFTEVPKLDPIIQSRMLALTKMIDRSLAGMQGYVLDAAVPLVNILESARSGTLGCTTRVCTTSTQDYWQCLGSPLSQA